MTSSLPPLVQAWSGALGSATANAISYPLDLVATKLQTTSSRKLQGVHGVLRLLRHILHTEGLPGLYDGLGVDTSSTLVSNFLYFYFYTLLHALAARWRGSSNTSLIQAIRRALSSPTRPTLLSVPAELAIGFAAGVASRAVSTPLGVITVRMQTENEDDEDDDVRPSAFDSCSDRSKPPHFTDIVRKIYREEGVAGFWAGFQPTLPLCLTPALTLLLFRLLSRLRLTRNTKASSSSVGAFFSGATANALATAILYPLLLAKVRVQASRKQPGRTMSMADVWIDAVQAEGWAGLYQGLAAQLVKGFVSQGVTMLVKQRIERAVVRLYTRRHTA
ncbi:mitochondrial carrier domain-containing protein [Trametes polyzona]|nr:mitochondrial carrier domain-containing protein [Trametes polyzona]